MKRNSLAPWVGLVINAIALNCIVIESRAAMAWAKEQPPRLMLATRLAFEPALETPDSVDGFVAIGPGYSVTLGPTGADLWLYSVESAAKLGATNRRSSQKAPWDDFRVKSARIRLELIGANRLARSVALERLPGTMNYFVGNDPAKWRTKISTYGKVKFAHVYPGIDWVCYGNQQQLEYDFVIAPGARPSIIAVKYEGAQQIEITRTGDLLVHASTGDLLQKRPAAYQIVNGERKEIVSSYVLADARTVRFILGDYDASKP